MIIITTKVKLTFIFKKSAMGDSMKSINLPSVSSMNFKSLLKIIALIFLGSVTFALSLFLLPYELFLLSTVIVFFALRGVEKELHKNLPQRSAPLKQ